MIKNRSFLYFSRESFRNAAPFLFGNAILVDVNIISKSIQVAAEHQGRIHEGAWIDELSFFIDLHFLDIEYEASIEDLLSDCTFTTKNHDFIVRNLVCKTHVTRDPVRLINGQICRISTCGYNLLPHILGDVIALNGVNNVFLINSTSKCKNEVVLE